MKNKTRVLFLTLVFSSIIYFSCDKNDNNNNQGTTKTDLISRDWLQIDLIAQVGSASQSIFDQEVPAAHHDDIYHFKADGGFSITEGTLKENPSDPDTVTVGTWQFLESETKVKIVPAADDPETFTIDELTATSFKGHIDSVYLGIPAKITTILQAK